MRHLLRPFIWIVAAVMSLLWFYLVSRLGFAYVSLGSAVIATLFFFVWLMPAVFWALDRDDTPWFLQLLQLCAFLSMGYLSFLGVVVIARDVFLLLPAHETNWSWARAAFSPAATPVIFGLAFLGLLAGMVGALGKPRVHEVEVPVENLPAGLDGFRIAQISDLHVGPTIRQRYVEGVVRIVNSLSADLVAITGDIADGMPVDLAERTASLALLLPRGRVFYVLGNHECYWDARKWVDELVRLGATALLNSAMTLEHRGECVMVGGVTDPAFEVKPDAAAAAPAELMGRASFRILLAHQPQIAPLANQVGFDLQLSGHTHAGQFFPWTLVAQRVHRQLVAGLSRAGKMWVYVSPGTGTWGPPVRLGTSPEVTLLKLKRV